ncbi:MAG: hypothetical protein H6835_19515 [Planctomycetes bacterium]|nr:hypothetical protein [Planctomycetota bacterium]
MPTLLVRFRRLSPERHVLEFVRVDGSRERVELETRSTLWHDLVHFAVESEARLRDAFYGRIARGVAYAALGRIAAERHDDGSHLELWHVERIVGPLQTAAKRTVDPAAFVGALRSHLAATGAACPSWFDEGFVVRALWRLRELDGRWRSTPFGEALELRFTAGAER